MPNPLTPAAIDAITASVERGTSLRQAALANHFTDDQVSDWYRIARHEPYRNGFQPSESLRKAVTELTERCQRAVAARYTVLTNSLYHNATTPNAKTGWFDTQAADKLLSKAPETRNDWFEHRQTTVTRAPDIHPAHTLVREMTTDELEALEHKALGAGEP